MSEFNNRWWDQIPNALRFINVIADSLSQKSIVLAIPEYIPWYRSLYDRLMDKLNSSECMIKEITDDSSEEPGKIILDSFCKPELRSAYRSSVGYARFLAAHDSKSEMSSCIAMIMGLSAQRLVEWAKLVSDYEKLHKPSTKRCIFLLEYKSDEPLPHSLPLMTIKWEDHIQSYDSYMYALLEVSMMSISREMKEYLAEIVSLVCGSDAELAKELIKYGQAVATKLPEVIREINESAYRSTGDPFDIKLTDLQLRSIVWTSQIKVVFPIIEGFRNELVHSISGKVGDSFRFETIFGDIKSDICELELGEILYLYSQQQISLTQEQLMKAKFFRTCRNTLAHFNTISYDDVKTALKQ